MINGLHIEVTNICTLKCSGCSRTQFINRWPQHWKNQYLDIKDVLNFIDIDLKEKNILLCGNYGDPIYHPDFINFVATLKNHGVNLHIITNGSYKTSDWWKELTDHLTETDTITFSIDGTPENFTNYRINGDWDSIHIGIITAVASKCKTEWKYIPFDYNQKDIESMQEFSRSLGIDNFFIELSNRFHAGDEYLKPADDLVGKKYSLQNDWKNSNILKVDPLCNQGRQHFISAEGFYSPCCMLTDFRFYYKTPFGKNKKQYNIKTSKLSEILQTPETVNFYQNLESHSVCQFNCPKVSKD